MTTQENTAERSLEPAARSVPLVAADVPPVRDPLVGCGQQL